MVGIAKKLFLERTFKGSSIEIEKPAKWPMLEKMLQAKRLGYVDLALANQLDSSVEESVAALICHLSMISRRGHICIKIEGDKITPSPEEIWITDEELVEPSFFDDEKLSQLIVRGTKSISSPLIFDTQSEKLHHFPIFKNGNAFYLQRYWQLESFFLDNFKKLFSHTQEIISVDQQLLQTKVKIALEKEKLLPEQAEAIIAASQSPLTLITGGPGTGKTYTAGMLLRLFFETLDVEKRADFKIALAAPTGKAAANLETSIRNALSDIKEFAETKAQTLHQLLGIKRNHGTHKAAVLNADLVLVDESSMIDIHLMGQLFHSLKPGSRLILLGDRYQLPSVEAGSLFADLIQYFVASSQGRAQVIELKTCLRAELKSIIELADKIKSGNVSETLSLFNEKKEGINLVPFDKELTGTEQQKRLLKYVIPFFPVVNVLPENPLDLLKQFAKFRLLSPIRKGPLGVDTLNALIFQALNGRKSSDECLITPIMILENDYKHDLFNGEVGLLIKEATSEFALFASRDSSQAYRKLSKFLLPRYEYAYCLSVHKSQGSEFDHVVLLLPEATQNFGREGLYTGVTRAKRQLDIWCKPDVFSQMITQVAARQSGVIERLST